MNCNGFRKKRSWSIVSIIRVFAWSDWINPQKTVDSRCIGHDSSRPLTKYKSRASAQHHRARFFTASTLHEQKYLNLISMSTYLLLCMTRDGACAECWTDCSLTRSASCTTSMVYGRHLFCFCCHSVAHVFSTYLPSSMLYYRPTYRGLVADSFSLEHFPQCRSLRALFPSDSSGISDIQEWLRVFGFQALSVDGSP
jgi:hypothetical protein